MWRREAARGCAVCARQMAWRPFHARRVVPHSIFPQAHVRFGSSRICRARGSRVWDTRVRLGTVAEMFSRDEREEGAIAIVADTELCSPESRSYARTPFSPRAALAGGTTPCWAWVTSFGRGDASSPAQRARNLQKARGGKRTKKKKQPKKKVDEAVSPEQRARAICSRTNDSASRRTAPRRATRHAEPSPCTLLPPATPSLLRVFSPPAPRATVLPPTGQKKRLARLRERAQRRCGLVKPTQAKRSTVA